ncbi:hypothetical protein GCM10022261_26440 [Brevibacterium daeguense]|uniref:NlpC/P60 domain-containing protein n=2 Tax=Brevibacterium daeguense TaxID=909936 RepID=A0ABP8EME7_9MICO
MPLVASCAAAVMVSTLGVTIPAAASGAPTVTPDIEERDLTSVDEDGLEAPGARSASPATAQTTNQSTTNLPNLLRSPDALTALGTAPIGTFEKGSSVLRPLSLAETPDQDAEAEPGASDSAPGESESAPAPDEAESTESAAPDMSGGVKEKTEDGINIAAISDVLDVPDSRSSVVGVTFANSESVTIEVRTKSASGWSDWYHLEEDNPGDGTPGTEPFVVSSATDVQIRVLGDEAPEDTRLMVIDPKHSAADAKAVEDNAPVAPPSTGGAEPVGAQPAAAGTQPLAVQPTGASATAGSGFVPGSASVENSSVKKVAKPAIASRKSWGANESLRKGSPDYASKVKAAVVHHTAGSNSYSAGDVPGILRGIYSYHTKGRGWSDIGYNVLADKFGRLWEGRAGGLDRAVIGAHVAGYNTGTFGISVMGTYEKSAPPQETIDAVNHAIAWKLSANGVSVKDRATVGGRTINAVVGHRDLGSTSCPGAAFYSKMGQMRDAIGKMQSSGAVESGKTEAPKPEPKPKTAIESFYEGKEDLLGKPVTKEWDHAGGKVVTYEKGYITWSKKTGPQLIRGAIGSLYKNEAMRNKLGLATAAEKGGLKGGGAFQKFQNGSVHWSKATGAQATWGTLQKYWGSKGYENGHLGYPKSAPTCTDDRCEQLFEGARLVWANGYGVTEFSPHGNIEGSARDLNVPQAGSADEESAEPGSGPAGPGEGSAGPEADTEDGTDEDSAPAGPGEGSAAEETEAPAEETPRETEQPEETEAPAEETEQPEETEAPAEETQEPEETEAPAEETQQPEEPKKDEPKPEESKQEEPKKEEPKSPAQLEQEKRDAVLATARKHLGVPYRWGGSSPRSGWDCSGYVQYVYAQNGIKLPRTTSAQRNAGKVIKASEAKPGDLVWIPGHIGIISETKGQMYDAGSSRTNTSKRSYSWMLSRGAVFIRVVD